MAGNASGTGAPTAGNATGTGAPTAGNATGAGAQTPGNATGAGEGGQASGASMAELVKQLAEQTTRLARQEVELARAELQVKGRRAGLGAGMFGGAGVFALLALGALTAAGILGLSKAVAAWLAALIVGGALALIAGLLALTGRQEVARAAPPVPEQATESVKEDVQWAKTRAQAARK